MKKVLFYVIVCAWLFALLDWKVVHATRWLNRDMLEWMHDHEQLYALITRSVEWVLCAPAMALKPLFYAACKAVEASVEEQRAITHAPGISWAGFYHLPKRGESWTFVSWLAWFAYWTPQSLLWWFLFGKRYAK